MSHERQYIVEKFNVETILSMKYQLMEDQLLEPVLNTNLDYAARVIPHMPHAILSDATLCIAGEKGLVKLIPNKQSGLDSPAQPHHSKINLTVICNDGQPQLIRRVTCGDVITHSDVKDAHFSGHNCQDMVQSCYQQAMEILSRERTADVKRRVLHIICNSLSLTYSAIDDAEDGQSRVRRYSPFNSHILKTQCRLYFPNAPEIEKLVRMKCWIEQEKPQKRGLIACANHLIKQYTVHPNATNSNYVGSNFILQSDGEMVTLLDNIIQVNHEYYIICGPNGVSMYPAEGQV